MGFVQVKYFPICENCCRPIKVITDERLKEHIKKCPALHGGQRNKHFKGLTTERLHELRTTQKHKEHYYWHPEDLNNWLIKGIPPTVNKTYK
jgi:hypothetical protein